MCCLKALRSLVLWCGSAGNNKVVRWCGGGVVVYKVVVVLWIVWYLVGCCG